MAVSKCYWITVPQNGRKIASSNLIRFRKTYEAAFLCRGVYDRILSFFLFSEAIFGWLFNTWKVRSHARSGYRVRVIPCYNTLLSTRCPSVSDKYGHEENDGSPSAGFLPVHPHAPDSILQAHTAPPHSDSTGFPFNGFRPRAEYDESFHRNILYPLSAKHLVSQNYFCGFTAQYVISTNRYGHN